MKSKKKKYIRTALLFAAVLIIIGTIMHPDEGMYSGMDGSAQIEPGAVVEGTNFLQLCTRDSETLYYSFRQGTQSAPLFTAEGEPVDETYKVYADKQLGTVKWSHNRGSWELNSEGKTPGITGLLHAEKEGKHYAVRCVVFGEPTCVYTEVPDPDNLERGYVTPEKVYPHSPQGTINLSYEKGRPLKLYYAAAPGFNLLDITCDSNLVSVEPFRPSDDYPFNICRMTVDTSGGGDIRFDVRTDVNAFTFNLKEK